jgi:hypothetical protein
MGYGFQVPDTGKTYIAIINETSSSSGESFSFTGQTDVDFATTYVNDNTDGSVSYSTEHSITGLSTKSGSRDRGEQDEVNRSTTGNSVYLTLTSEQSGERGSTSVTKFSNSDDETGSGSTSYSESDSFTFHSISAHTSRTVIQSTSILVERTNSRTDDSTTYSSSFENSKEVGISDTVNRQFTAASKRTTSTTTESSDSRLTTATMLMSSTSKDRGMIFSSTTSTTSFVSQAFSTSKSTVTVTQPFTTLMKGVFVTEVSTVALPIHQSVASNTIHVEKGKPFDPLGVAEIIDAGDVDDVLEDFSNLTAFQKSKERVTYKKGDSSYAIEDIHSEDQLVSYATINGSDVKQTVEITQTLNPLFSKHETSFDVTSTVEETYCGANFTSTFSFSTTSTSTREQEEISTSTFSTYAELTTSNSSSSEVTSTSTSLVNVHVTNSPTILTTEEISAETTVSSSYSFVDEARIVLSGDLQTSYQFTFETNGTEIEDRTELTLSSNREQVKLEAHQPYYVGGAFTEGHGAFLSFSKQANVKGFSPFNMSTESRPSPFMGYSTEKVATEGFVSWDYVEPDGVQRFAGITNLDEAICKTVSDTFTHSDVTFEQTVSDSDDIQYFSYEQSFADADDGFTTTAFETTTTTTSTHSTSGSGESFSTSTTTGYGHSVAATTTSAALVTMTRVWTTGFMTEDSKVNASARFLTYRGKYGNKGTIKVVLCESMELESFEYTSVSKVISGPAEVTLRAPYHLRATLRDSSTSTTTDFFDGERNTARETQTISLQKSSNYSFEAQRMIIPSLKGPRMIDANVYEDSGFTVLRIEED